MKKNNYLFKLVLTSLLIALNVILERFFAYSVWNQTISFSFITIAFAAVFLGIPYAVAVGVFGDLIGAILFPFGAYFVGFTITNGLAALILAVFIYKNADIIKIFLAVLINLLTTTLILNTIWISILYKGGLEAFWVVFASRIPQAALMLVVQTVIISLLFSNKSKIKLTIEKAMKKIIS